jgi:inner membrane protein
MSPLTHWQMGALLANVRNYRLRERRLIMAAAMAADVDGAGVLQLPDYPGVCIGLGRHFQDWHHTFGHSIFFGLLLAALFGLISRGRRLELFGMSLAAYASHLVLDLLTNGTDWPHGWLWPLRYRFSLDQWFPGEGFNTLLMVYVQYSLMALIFGGIVYVYLKKGRTFLELISTGLDRVLTDFIALPLRRVKCAACGRRALYRTSRDLTPLCPLHVQFRFEVASKEDSVMKADNHD